MRHTGYILPHKKILLYENSKEKHIFYISLSTNIFHYMPFQNWTSAIWAPQIMVPK